MSSDTKIVKSIINLKKVANEPQMMCDWLHEMSSLVKNPELVQQFERVIYLMDNDLVKNQESVEQRARRKADVVGLHASKGKAPYSKNNIGLFQLVNPRTDEVVAGKHFDLTANEVLRYCTALNHAIFNYVNIPQDQYQRDPEQYWKMKEKAVDELLNRKLISNTGSLMGYDEIDVENIDWDDRDELRAALLSYMKKSGAADRTGHHL